MENALDFQQHGRFNCDKQYRALGKKEMKHIGTCNWTTGNIHLNIEE